MKKRRNKILIFLSMLFVLAMSFVIPSYAWSVDSNGNLESQNILSFDDATYNGLGVTFECRDNKIYLNGTATSSGPLWVPINIESGSYVFQTFNDFTYNDGFRLTLRNGYGTIKASCSYSTTNAYDIFTSNVDLDILAISVVGGVNYNNVVLTPSLVVGSIPLTSYEPYGQMYYSQSNIERIAYNDYNVFQFASNITITYNNGSSIGTLVSYDNIISAVQDNVFTFSNGSLTLVYNYLNTLSGGNSTWFYTLSVTFRNNKVKISNFDDWSITNFGANLYFLSYSNTSYSSASATGAPLTIKLTNNGFSGDDYLKQLSFDLGSAGATPLYNFRYVGVTSSISNDYVNGYNDGKNEGLDIGFDNGFTDGKEEGYTMGYNEGFRDGETHDLATNGFKTLIASIFNYPINFIRSVFNFEFMGINISSMIFFILSIGIVIFVIRRFKK